jgi:hypothetical protein
MRCRQVSLYLLLMEVRYQLGLPPMGLLWNVNSPTMTLVPAKQEELSALLSCRNRLAAHLWQEVPPPPSMLGVRPRFSVPCCAGCWACRVHDRECFLSSLLHPQVCPEVQSSVRAAGLSHLQALPQRCRVRGRACCAGGRLRSQQRHGRGAVAGAGRCVARVWCWHSCCQHAGISGPQHEGGTV